MGPIWNDEHIWRQKEDFTVFFLLSNMFCFYFFFCPTSLKSQHVHHLRQQQTQRRPQLTTEDIRYFHICIFFNLFCLLGQHLSAGFALYLSILVHIFILGLLQGCHGGCCRGRCRSSRSSNSGGSSGGGWLCEVAGSP